MRAAWAMNEENVLLSIGSMIYELDLNSGQLSEGFFCGEGIRPLIFTQVEGISSVDEGIYFGGYLGNRDKSRYRYINVSVMISGMLYIHSRKAPLITFMLS